MKHVYTNSELPHIWAHDWRRVGNGRNAGETFYFQQNTIYSYGAHFPIARIVEVNDQDCALFTTENYSNTTGTHKSHVRSALNGLMPVYYVTDVMAETTDDHMRNWRDLRSALNEQRNAIRNAKVIRDYMINAAFAAAKAANEYAESFGLRPLLAENEYPLVAYTQAERERFTAEINRQTVLDHIRDEKAAERRALAETQKAKAQAKLAKLHARLVVFEKLTFGLYRAPTIRYGVLASTAGYTEPRKTRAERKSIAEKVSDWKRSKGPFPYGYNGPTVMRINSDRETVQTSKGARFPVSDCVEIWPEIKASKQQKTKTDDIKKRTIGLYRVQYLDNGNVKAGCHYMTYDECRKLAIVLGIEKPTFVERMIA